MTRRKFFGLVGAALLPAPLLLVPRRGDGATYWSVQLTLTTTAKQIYTAVKAIDSSIPSKPGKVNFQFDPVQFDPLNPYSKEIFIGNVNVSSARKSYGLYPGGTCRYDFVTDLTQLYALGNITGLLLNVELFS